MPYAGKTLMQREVVALVAPHWPNSKVKATATAIAESHCSIGAWHDNLRADESVKSRDCGLFQISIKGEDVGSDTEERLRTESLTPDEYLAVARYNVKWAHGMWTGRKWQPWVAYTSGWATYPEAWVWSRVDPATGQLTDQPHGPWKKAGRYLHQAIRAVANWHLLINKSLDEKEALAEAERLAAQFGVTKGDLTYDKLHAVYWLFPPAPSEPSTTEPWGYPTKNDGR